MLERPLWDRERNQRRLICCNLFVFLSPSTQWLRDVLSVYSWFQMVHLPTMQISEQTKCSFKSLHFAVVNYIAVDSWKKNVVLQVYSFTVFFSKKPWDLFVKPVTSMKYTVSERRPLNPLCRKPTGSEEKRSRICILTSHFHYFLPKLYHKYFP